MLHLVGGLVGEGDGQQLEGRDAVLFDEVGDPVCQHAGLARSGARHQQQRAVGVHDGLSLGGVQTFQQGALRLVVGHRATLPTHADTHDRPSRHHYSSSNTGSTGSDVSRNNTANDANTTTTPSTCTTPND